MKQQTDLWPIARARLLFYIPWLTATV